MESLSEAPETGNERVQPRERHEPDTRGHTPCRGGPQLRGVRTHRDAGRERLVAVAGPWDVAIRQRPRGVDAVRREPAVHRLEARCIDGRVDLGACPVGPRG